MPLHPVGVSPQRSTTEDIGRRTEDIGHRTWTYGPFANKPTLPGAEVIRPCSLPPVAYLSCPRGASPLPPIAHRLPSVSPTYGTVIGRSSAVVPQWKRKVV